MSPSSTPPRTGELFGRESVPRPRREIAPGAHWLPDFLSLSEQQRIVRECRELGRRPVPDHPARIRNGRMRVSTLSLGWHWYPYGYSRVARNVNGERVLPVPPWLVELGRRAVAEATGDAAAGRRHVADAALVNFYSPAATMGMHQDGEEKVEDPIVSLSIGDTCTFRFGTPESRGQPYSDIALASGDLVVFGGQSRRAFHGVPKIHAGTAPEGCGLAEGRLNITLRVTGMDG